MSFTGNYISIMIDGLQKKIKILSQIVQLTNKEKDLLTQDAFNSDEFEKNLQEKSDLVEQLSALDEGFTSVFDRVKVEFDTNKHLFGREIQEMKRLITQITELSVTIQSQEKRNKELATKQFSAMKSEVKQVKYSQNTASKYYKSMNMIESEPQFIDRKK